MTLHARLLASVFVGGFPLSVFCCDANLLAMTYAERVREIIVSGNVSKFQSLPCVPADCIGIDDVEYVFGAEGDESFIRRFLKRPSVEVRVFGPFTREDAFGSSTFSIVYYDPFLVDFNESGHMNPVDRKNQWNKGYVETLVTCKDGECAFHRTPFYYGAHIPWMEDY